MEQKTSTITSRQLLEKLQGNINCPKFRDLIPQDQRLLANEVAIRLGFGSEHIDLWFDDKLPDIEKSINTAIKQNKAPQSILLSGTVGSGKTAFMSVAIKERFLYWANKCDGKSYILPALFSINCIMVTHQELVDIINAEFNDNIEENHSKQDLKDIGILVIDDLCNASETDKNITRLADIIDYRWKNGKTTWITTNLSGKDLSKRTGYERMYDRLTDPSWMIYLEINEKSRR